MKKVTCRWGERSFGQEAWRLDFKLPPFCLNPPLRLVGKDLPNSQPGQGYTGNPVMDCEALGELKVKTLLIWCYFREVLHISVAVRLNSQDLWDEMTWDHHNTYTCDQLESIGKLRQLIGIYNHFKPWIDEKHSSWTRNPCMISWAIQPDLINLVIFSHLVKQIQISANCRHGESSTLDLFVDCFESRITGISGEQWNDWWIPMAWLDKLWIGLSGCGNWRFYIQFYFWMALLGRVEVLLSGRILIYSNISVVDWHF